MAHPAISRSENNVLHLRPNTAPDRTNIPVPKRFLGQILEDMGALSTEDHATALALCRTEITTLEEVLLARGYVSEDNLKEAQTRLWQTTHVDLSTERPDPRLIQKIDTSFCLTHGIVPVKTLPGGVIVATAYPSRFAAVRATLEPEFGHVFMVLAPERDIHECLLQCDQRQLAQQAEKYVKDSESCRNWNTPILHRWMIVLGGLLFFAVLQAPAAVLGAFCIWAVMTLFLSTAMKLAAAIAQRNHIGAFKKAQERIKFTLPEGQHMPRVSILVPLFREREIASKLIERLQKIDYPRELLEICLVTEADDTVTSSAIKQTTLPRWMRVIPVPNGSLRTKPRAMNFALDFCKGSIIGIYDAEDRPDPDQILRVVERFAISDPEVACLQGCLDYYNARSNWLSRCFTIEYATWFRLILPGLVRMGFVIPLGGTTLFFRRAALEKLGRWDAHNVTEDADIGIRLARYGYRSELIETVTEEEANCRVLPWIKQRSRWLKGYAITWAVHMRSPRALLRDLGLWRFCGFQLLFLGTLSQYVLLPVLWTFWLIPMGVWHPLSDTLSDVAFIAIAVAFLFSEITSLVIGLLAVRGKKHRFLSIWVPSLPIYFPLGALASYKGLWELMTAPFYWDKTVHGVFDPVDDNTNKDAAAPLILRNQL